jgi:ADP-heptose:LPS heptosyltransferase
MASLRKAYPEASIDWVVQVEFREAIESHPALNKAILFPRKRFSSWWRNPRIARELWRWLGEIRRARYDLVLDCQGLFRSGVISFFSRAPKRLVRRSARELAWLGSNVRIAESECEHTVDQMMTLIEALAIDPIPDMRLYSAQTDRDWWTDCRSSHDREGGTYAVIAPTSRWSTKRWPVERFLEVVPGLVERGFSFFVLLGGPGEETQVLPLTKQLPESDSNMIDLVGSTSVGQSMAIIEQSGLVIANDSALLHMAVGFERKSVALFGPTEPAKVEPYGMPGSVLRKFVPDPDRPVYFKDKSLGDSLMRLISVEDVLNHVDEILAPSTDELNREGSVS